jgi:hypothetical protein
VTGVVCPGDDPVNHKEPEMPDFILIYRNPTTYVASHDDAAVAAWRTFIGHDLDGHVVEMGLPVFQPAGTTGDVGPDTVLCGYSVIRAEDLETATGLAKLSPPVANGGGVEVGLLEPVDGM